MTQTTFVCPSCGNNDPKQEVRKSVKNLTMGFCVKCFYDLSVKEYEEKLEDQVFMKHENRTITKEYFDNAYIKSWDNDDIEKENYLDETKKMLYKLRTYYKNKLIDKNKKATVDINTIIFNQENAISEMEKLQLLARYQIKRDHKPFYSVLFTGPTGVGKTQLAIELAKKYSFNFLKLNMADYFSEHMKAKILGAPAGYRDSGSDTAFKELDSSVPTIVLLDEFEKADESIQEIFLSILDKGELTTSDHKTISFKNAMLIFTTNLGVNYQVDNKLGLSKNVNSTNHVVDMNKVKAKLLPEFIGRLTNIVEFNALTHEVSRKIVEKNIQFWQKKIQRDRNISFTVTDSIIDDLVNKGFSPLSGARNIETTVEKVLMFNIVKALSEKDVERDVLVTVKDNYVVEIEAKSVTEVVELNSDVKINKKIITENLAADSEFNWKKIYKDSHKEKEKENV